LLRNLVEENNITNYIAWFYTPMMLDWSRWLSPKAVIYDCMDELSHFRNAPPELCSLERELFERADLVFTGGQSLYEAKRVQHHSVYAFPSSIDTKHFSRAQEINEEFPDHAGIPHPRVGFVGVIDERLDIPLLAEIADKRPNISFVMVGPVVKISEDDLPRRNNIYYLGQKAYEKLPAILSGWDVAMMPFALNNATKFISPTKTPEYLAAGLPVVSTPITDVVQPYGERSLVHIASTAEEFVRAIDQAHKQDSEERRSRVRSFLADMSWDKTYNSMSELIQQVVTASDDRKPLVAEAR
ncbi:MAG: glycosyltransferase, partial [Pyrinomonadaceae bacterium]